LEHPKGVFLSFGPPGKRLRIEKFHVHNDTALTNASPAKQPAKNDV